MSVRPRAAVTPFAALVLGLLTCLATERGVVGAEGLSYTNIRVANIPWSIHVVRIARTNGEFEVRSTHAEEGATGLSPLSAQTHRAAQVAGTAVAAINGDFYQRDRAYFGDPRGLQVVDGEVISAPNGGTAFWIDPAGHPVASNVVSRFEAVWPDGRRLPFGLNGERHPDRMQLYTPALGASTRTSGGRELVLERAGQDGVWLPLAMGQEYSARVREVRETGNAPLAPGTLVLSLGPLLPGRCPSLRPVQS